MTVQRRRSSYRLIAASAVTAGVIVVAGCSGSASDDEGAGTLSVLIAAPQEGAGKILEEEFEKTHDVDVTAEVVPYDQIQSKVTLDVQSGTSAYDVIQYWYPTVGALAEAGALADITDWVAE
ncbi:MAG: extracellular solute-binding protein, partial [Candidatus Microbacterium stercoravium]